MWLVLAEANYKQHVIRACSITYANILISKHYLNINDWKLFMNIRFYEPYIR